MNDNGILIEIHYNGFIIEDVLRVTSKPLCEAEMEINGKAKDPNFSS
jgi:hypothetical protein